MPNDQFGLPKTEVAGRCKLTVEMALELGVVEDQGDWPGLKLLATALNTFCTKELGIRYLGGWVLGGQKGGIVVRFGPVGYGAANGTILESRWEKDGMVAESE